MNNYNSNEIYNNPIENDGNDISLNSYNFYGNTSGFEKNNINSYDYQY